MKITLLSIFLFLSHLTFAQTDTTIYGYVDSVTIRESQVPPVFPGGQAAWKRFTEVYLSYPKDAKKNKIEGDVIVEFLVDTTGHVSDIKLIKSVYPSLDEKALDAINHSMWLPAIQNAHWVKYRKRQVISYHL